MLYPVDETEAGLCWETTCQGLSNQRECLLTQASEIHVTFGHFLFAVNRIPATSTLTRHFFVYALKKSRGLGQSPSVAAEKVFFFFQVADTVKSPRAAGVQPGCDAPVVNNTRNTFEIMRQSPMVAPVISSGKTSSGFRPNATSVRPMMFVRTQRPAPFMLIRHVGPPAAFSWKSGRSCIGEP